MGTKFIVGSENCLIRLQIWGFGKIGEIYVDLFDASDVIEKVNEWVQNNIDLLEFEKFPEDTYIVFGDVQNSPRLKIIKKI